MSNLVKKKLLNEIADEVAKKILENDEPFNSMTLVFQTARVAQWFKAYFLKNYDEVLMNVSFLTMRNFVNELLKVNDETIMEHGILRKYILKALLSGDFPYKANSPINYIYKNSRSINGINLYEFAGKLASLFIQYEGDGENMTGWEKEVYDKAKKLALKDGCYTAKTLYEKNKDAICWNKFENYFVMENSYVTPFASEIIKKTNATIYSLEMNDEIEPKKCEFFSAPSLLREVEGIHSDICKKIKNNKDLRYNDFVVYAPNINNYASSIRRVFEQDNIEYPEIPYTIVGETVEKQDMAKALNVFFDMANKRFFTRMDLYKLAQNPIVVWAKNLEDEDIATWVDVIDKTNTYRNGKSVDDWEYIKNRLLLHVLVADTSDYDNKTEINGDDYLPYYNFSLSDSSMNKLIDFINVLEQWVSLFDKELNETILDQYKEKEILECLNSIFSIGGANGEEKNYIYKKVQEELEGIIEINDKIPANTLMLLLIDSPSKYVAHAADMFVKGVTFLNINYEDVVSSKHTYVMGMMSKDFPRENSMSELDESNNHKSMKELDELAIKNLFNNSESVIFSFINMDLKSQEEYYLSSAIKPYIDEALEKKIPLDETRDYGELFTRREFKSRKYYEGIGNKNQIKFSLRPNVNVESNVETVIKTSEMVDFLMNPFIYKYKKVIGDGYENESIFNEYEPIDIDAANKSKIKKKIIKDRGSDTNDKLKIEHELPNKTEGEHYNMCEEELGNIKVKIASYKPFGIDSIDLKCTNNGKGLKWTLKYDNDAYVDEKGTDLSFIDVKSLSEKEIVDKKVVGEYICSLMNVASRNGSKEYNIKLDNNGAFVEYNVTPSGAREKLNEIYKKIIDYDDMKYVDKKHLLEGGCYNSVKAIVDDDYSSWKRYKDEKLIDPYATFGYSAPYDFENEYYEEIEKLRSLFLYL